MRTDEYLTFPEDLRRRELVWGVVHEPPSPFAPHQLTTTRIAALLDQHVRQHDLGAVLVAPMDVVLDAEKHLVLQPDVLFISRARTEILQDFVRGAPDLVVEVASPATAQYDRTRKVGWYRAYGVRECWLVDPQQGQVVVFQLSTDAPAAEFAENAVVRSSVLPLLDLRAGDLLAAGR